MQYLIPYDAFDLYFKDGQFALDTQKQLVKDFASFNLHFEERFSNEPYPIEKIYVCIANQLIEIMKEGETRLLQLLLHH